MALYLGKESTYERDTAMAQKCEDEAVYIPQTECGDCGDYGEAIAALQQSVRTLDAEKQDKLEAGENIHINGNVISADDTKYVAGQNVTINGNVISASGGPTYTAGENVQINNNVISATDTTYVAGNEYVEVDNTDHRISVVGMDRLGAMMYAMVSPGHTIGYGAYELQFSSVPRDGGYGPSQSGLFSAPFTGIYNVVLQLDLQLAAQQQGHQFEYRIVKASDFNPQDREASWNSGEIIARSYGGTSASTTSVNKSYLTVLEEGEGYYIMAKDSLAWGGSGATVMQSGVSWVQVAYLGPGDFYQGV